MGLLLDALQQRYMRTWSAFVNAADEKEVVGI
jgi:hypothetical protein